MGFKSPRSAAVLIDDLVSAGYLRKTNGKIQLVRDSTAQSSNIPTVQVPILGTAPCGAPFFAEENLEGYVQVDARMAPPRFQHFIVRAQGDSMDRAGIRDGEFVLVRNRQDAADGDCVVALVDGEVTIKILHHRKSVAVLEPKSTNPRHQPIFAMSNLQIQGIVVTSLG